jgi:dihydrofolate synthase / folylpolyglutamate synthase
MNYTDLNEAFTYIASFTNLERTAHYTVRTYRLDRMRALLDWFDHPERAFKTVHVAGSKGKGSTSLFIQAGLTAAGMRTGLYLSPHVSDYRERFTIDNGFADEQSMLRVMNAMLADLEGFSFAEETGYSKPTTFELLTLFGFLLFKDAGCDWAVLETGLGGRLDATNVVTPELSVITSIELEHTAILGDTIAKIAFEKGGIIKQGINTVIGFLKPEAEQVIRDICSERGSTLYLLRETLKFYSTATLPVGESCRLEWKLGLLEDCCLMLQMRGSFQADNAALALLSLSLIGMYRGEFTLQAISGAVLPGRLEKLGNAPPLYIDGAHTEASLTKLYDSFSQLHDGKGILIFGAVLDKNHRFMAEHSVRRFKRIIISTPGTFKQSDPEALFRLFIEKRDAAGLSCSISLIPDAHKALAEALRESGNTLPVLVTGSFYMAAEIRTLLRGSGATKLL